MRYSCVLIFFKVRGCLFPDKTSLFSKSFGSDSTEFHMNLPRQKVIFFFFLIGNSLLTKQGGLHSHILLKTSENILHKKQVMENSES